MTNTTISTTAPEAAAATTTTTTDNNGAVKRQEEKTTTNSNAISKENVTVHSSTTSDVVRKTLGCRRNDDDMLVSSDEDEEDTRQQPPRRKLFFTSPRLVTSDDTLFPVNHSPYKKSNERWQQISDQAGSHRQDGTVITIGRKLSPMALRIGMTKQAASRVRCLNLWLDHDKDILPEWLDVIAEVFTNLEHLTLTEDVFPGEDELAVSARMRRLYVLYRLPYLKSIDDMAITVEERRLARPNETDPNGDRVIKSQLSSLLDQAHDNDGDSGRCDDDLSYNVDHETLVDVDHNDKYSTIVNSGHNNNYNDNSDDDDDDVVGKIPSLGSTTSATTKTAREDGVEIDQRLAEKFAELNQAITHTTASETTDADFDDLFDDIDDELAGVAMLSDLAASSQESSPEMDRYEEIYHTASGGDIEVVDHLESVASQDTTFSQGDAVEVDLSGQVKQGSSRPCRKSISTKRSSSNDCNGTNDCGRTCIRSQIHDTSDNSIELVSVASTDVEWSAACGVLSFRSDRTCAPRLRMPFCSSRNRKAVAADDAVQAIRQAKVNLRNKQRDKEAKNGKSCPPVPRNANPITTPQARCCNLITEGSSNSFFSPKEGASGSTRHSREKLSSISSNKQLPPSKSLSSPFPMQFRERQVNPLKAPLVVKTVQSTDSSKSNTSSDDTKTFEMETISSPLQSVRSFSTSPKNTEQAKLKSAGKGDLPPPCPPGSRRKVPVPSSKVRKSKRSLRQIKASKENARSTSVMDLDDDEEEDGIDVDEEEVSLSGQESESNGSNGDTISLACSSDA